MPQGNSLVDSELVVGRGLVADGALPLGALLLAVVQLLEGEVVGEVEALNVRAIQALRRYNHPRHRDLKGVG